MSFARKTSLSFFRRMSTWACTMSFGLSGNGRRSTPTTGPVRCSTRASCLPSRPQMPVTSTAPLEWTGALAVIASPENVFALLESFDEHRVNGLPHEPYLFFEDGIVFVDVSGKAHRFPEP